MSFEEVGKVVHELREVVEKNNSAASSTKEKIEKMSAAIFKLEETNNELALKKAEIENRVKDIEEKNIELEKQASRIGAGSSEEKTDQYKRYEKFILDTENPGHQLEKKYLRTDIDTQGGYLVVPDVLKEIIKYITELSPVRRLSRVKKTSSKDMKISVRTSRLVATWIGEGQQDTSSNSTYGMKDLPMNKMQVTVPITIESLMDSYFDMSTEINSDTAEAFEELESQAFVNGDGIAKPHGFMVNKDIAEIETAGVGAITFDDVFRLIAEIKKGYNPAYLFNRRTLVYLMQLKNGQGTYLWNPGIPEEGVPSTIAGFPYYLEPNMDDVTVVSGSPIAYVDLRRGYLIGDRMSMSVIKDIYSKKTEGFVEFTFKKRLGAQVVNPEALSKLTVQAP